MKEFEIIGFYFSGHPLTDYNESLIENNVRDYVTIVKSKELQESKNILVAGTLLAKKEKRSARGNAYAFLNFSDTTSIYEGIIFESNLRKYRDKLIVGQSYVLGADLTDDNGQIRVEIKKVYNLDEIINKNNSQELKSSQKILKIYTNSMTAIQLIKQLDIPKGSCPIFLFFEDKKIKLGDNFEINDILLEKIRKIPEIINAELSYFPIEL